MIDKWYLQRQKPDKTIRVSEKWLIYCVTPSQNFCVTHCFVLYGFFLCMYYFSDLTINFLWWSFMLTHMLLLACRLVPHFTAMTAFVFKLFFWPEIRGCITWLFNDKQALMGYLKRRTSTTKGVLVGFMKMEVVCGNWWPFLSKSKK